MKREPRELSGRLTHFYSISAEVEKNHTRREPESYHMTKCIRSKDAAGQKVILGTTFSLGSMHSSCKI